jgi:hypothetical protein
MNITPDQFLTKLAASPADAREFDACAPRGMSRRAHAELILARVNSSCANVAESKRLADQRAINAKLKSDLALAKSRIALAKAIPTPVKPATSAAKSCLGNTNLSKVSAFFGAQARK